MGLLYLFFRSRRVQRPIPVVVPNINTTLEYVKTVGQIYFRNKNHRQLALLQKQLLMQHLASRYSIRLNASSEQLRREVMIRTGITEELAVKLFRAIAMLEERKKITAEELVHWYETLDQFYQTNQKRYGNIQQSAGNRI